MRLGERATRILSSVAWLTGSSWISSVLAAARGVIFASILGPSGYGIWSLISSAQSLSLNADLGMQQVAARDLARAGDGEASMDSRRLAWTTLAWNMVVAVLVGAFVVFFVALGQSEAPAVVRLVPLAFLGMNGLAVAQSIARGLLRFREAATVYVVAGVAALLLGTLASELYGVTGLVLSQATVYGLFGAILVRSVGIGRPVLYGALPVLHSGVRFGWRLLLPNLMLQVFVSVDIFAAGLLLGPEKTGQYSVALLASSMLAGALASSVASVVGQHLIRGTENARPSQSLVWDTAAALSLGLALLCGAGAVVVPWLVRLLLPGYAKSAELVPILLCCAFYLHSQFGYSAVFVAADRPLTTTPLFIVLVCVNIAIDAWLVSLGWGLLGIASGTLVVNVLFSIVHPLLVARLVPSPGWAAQVVLSVLAGGIVLGVAAWGRIPYLPGFSVAIGAVACVMLAMRMYTAAAATPEEGINQ